MAIDVQDLPQSPQADEQAYYGYAEIWQQELELNWSLNGYTQMPNIVRQDRSLSHKAKEIYEQLLSFMWNGTDRAWPSQETLAEATGYSRSSIIRGLQELYERGYIERYRPGLGSNNIYFVNPLSFTHSFQRAEGPRTWYSMPHNNLLPANAPELRKGIDTATPRPAKPFYSEVANCNMRSRKKKPEMSQNVTQTIRNESENTSEANNRYFRNGAAALRGEGVAAKAIGNGSTTKTKKGTKNQSTQPIEPKPKSNDPVPSGENGRAAAPRWRRKKHAPGEVPPPMPDNVKELLEPISLRFCDESPESSRTSMAWLYDDLHQRGLNASSPTFVNLLNEAIDTTINRTPTIRALNKDGSIAQMRYFWSVLERLVNKWCKEHDAVPAQNRAAPQNEQARTAPAPELPEEQDPANSLQDDSADSSTQSEALATDVQEPLSAESYESDLQLEQAQSADIVEEQMPVIHADKPTVGWSLTNVHHFGRQIRDLFGQNDYVYEVRPIVCNQVRCRDRYGFIIKEQEWRGGRVYGEFTTIGQVGKCRNLAQNLNAEEGETRKRLATIPRRDLGDDPPTETQEPTLTADTPERLAAEIGAIHKPDHPHRCGCTVYYLSASGSELCARCLPQRGIDNDWYERLRTYYRVHLHLIQ